MKPLVIAFFIFLSSCSSIHTVPDDKNSKHAIHYCGGELWGYVLPIGPRESGNFWTKKFEDPKPLLAVFMHMHSVLEKDPEHSLTFHFALRTREDLAVHFPEKDISVRFPEIEDKKLKLDFIANEDALTLNELYPSTEFDSELVDQESNQWKITKRTGLVSFNKVDPQIITLPTSKIHKITENPMSLKFDKTKYGQIFVLSSVNVWPSKESLKDTKITIQIPSFVLNGTTYLNQTFTFNTNYEKVKKVRSSYGRCPSTEEIFRFNH